MKVPYVYEIVSLIAYSIKCVLSLSIEWHDIDVDTMLILNWAQLFKASLA